MGEPSAFVTKYVSQNLQHTNTGTTMLGPGCCQMTLSKKRWAGVGVRGCNVIIYKIDRYAGPVDVWPEFTVQTPSPSLIG